MKTLKIGIVGGGGMGRVHYANWNAIEGAEVVALCDNAPHAPETAKEWNVPLFSSITEMVNAGLDVVDICTPTFLHHDMVMEALNLGVDTICEKPIALSYRDAREMLDTAESKGCNLYIAQVLQFTKEIQALHKLVETEEYGKVLDASFERLSACPRWAVGGWLFDKNKSGLLPFDLHIHDLDVIVSLFGKPDSFEISTCRGRDKTYPEAMRINYRYGDLRVNGEAAWYNGDFPWTARWRVYFENAVVVNDGNGMIAYQFDKEPRVFDTKDEVEISTGINVPPCGWYYNELKHFAECIREKKPTPYVTREQLLTVMEILEEVAV